MAKTTVTSITTEVEEMCVGADPRIGSVVCSEFNVVKRHRDFGDGSVPLLSAERIGNGKNLNVPTAQLYRFCSNDAAHDDSVEHNGLHQNVLVQDWVLALLQSNNPVGFPETCGAQASAATPQYNELTLLGAEGVTLFDNTHNSTTPITGTIFGAVLGVDLPFAQKVTFRSTGQPLLIEVQHGLEDRVAKVVRFRDLVVPEGVKANLEIRRRRRHTPLRRRWRRQL